MDVSEKVGEIYKKLESKLETLPKRQVVVGKTVFKRDCTPEDLVLDNYMDKIKLVYFIFDWFKSILEPLPRKTASMRQLSAEEKSIHLGHLNYWNARYVRLKSKLISEFDVEPNIYDTEEMLKSYVTDSREYAALLMDEAVASKETDTALEQLVNSASDAVKESLDSKNPSLAYVLLKTGCELSIKSKLKFLDGLSAELYDILSN